MIGRQTIIQVDDKPLEVRIVDKIVGYEYKMEEEATGSGQIFRVKKLMQFDYYVLEHSSGLLYRRRADTITKLLT